MKLKLYFSILITLLTCSLFSQELVVKVSKTNLAVNQRLRVEFSMQGQRADNFKAPKFKDFTPLNRYPTQSVGEEIYINNGKVTRSINTKYTFVIQPKRQGTLTIEPASVSVNGKIVKSKPLKIRVTKAVKVPKNPNDPNYLAGQNAHLVAHVSNTNPYVGEGIFVEYRIYAKKEISISYAGGYTLPKYEGFWSQKIKGGNRNWKKGKYQGQDYEYYVLERALLVPTKTGKLNIDAISLDLYVEFPVVRRDLYGNLIRLPGRSVKKTFTAPKRSIKAEQLPTENRPESFNGAVGDFDFSVLLSKNSLKANESSELKVAVVGQGNMKSFPLPKIDTPDELEVYKPERKDKLSTMPNGLKGHIWEKYTIVPNYKGQYKIPSVSFSYFNPKDKQYHTIKSKDLVVDVLEGKELPSSVSGAENKEVKSVGDEFRYIQNSKGFQPKEQTTFFNSFWYYVLLILPLLVVPVVIFIRKKGELKRGDIKGNKIRNADKLAKKYLAEAQQNLGKKEAFYESLERALHNYLKANLGVETSDISRDKITELLQDKNVNKETISDFMNVLNDCNFARYTPTTDVQMQAEYQKAKKVILELDKSF